MKTFTYTIKDENGIHARPAGLLVKEAQKFSSDATLTMGEKKGDMKKLFGLLGLNIKRGDCVTVILEGADEAAAQADLQAFMAQNF